MARGKRDAAPVAPVPESGFTEQMQANLEVIRDEHSQFAALTEGALQQQALFSQYVGRVQSFNYTQKNAAVAALLLIKQIKESKLYKGMRVHSIDGELPPCGTFEDFCTAISLSRSKVDEDLQNLEALGTEFLEYSNKMGLGRTMLRQIRALPEEDRQLIIEGQKVGNDPEALKELLEEIVAKQAKDKDTLQKEIDKKTKDLEASRKVAADERNERLALKEDLIKLKSIPPDEEVLLQGEKERNALHELFKQGLLLTGAWTAFMAQIVALDKDYENLSNTAKDYILQIASSVCAGFARDLNDYGVEIDFRRYVYPIDDDYFKALRGELPDAEGQE
jgi:hypothetical protein